jgi:hypothetical protein
VYIFANKIIVNNHSYFWQDGFFSKIFLKKYKKLPRRKLINTLKINNNIRNIHVIGNLSLNSKIFLEKKYKLEIKHTPLPFGNINNILQYVPKTNQSELVFITLPTPKQEIIANYISKKNINYKIICIGGGLGMASKDERPCPTFIEKMYLEFLWRLQYQTLRRILRLFYTLYLLFLSTISLFNKRIVFNEKKK